MTSKTPVDRYRPPRREHTIAVRIDDQLFRAINRAAEENEVSVADIVRARLKLGFPQDHLKTAAA
jgi:hypothetical protein